MVKSDMPKLLAQFRVALSRFEEVLQKDAKAETAFIDASIQRFEFCFELCWKLLRRCLEVEGLSVSSPREAFSEAFQLQWLSEGDDFWTKMIESRNLSSHTYKEETALELYARLPEYREAYLNLYDFLSRRYG